MIPPGQVGSVRAGVKTEKLRGSHVKQVVVHTDDPEQQRLNLMIRVEVLSSVQLLPSETVRLSNRGGAGPLGQVIVRKDPRESGTLELSDVVSSSDKLDVAVRRIAAAGESVPGLPPVREGDWVLQVRPSAEAPYQQGRETVRFKTGLQYEPEVEIPLAVDLTSPLQWTPKKLVLTPRSPNAVRVTRKLRVTLRHDLGNAELSVRSKPESIRTTIETPAPRRGLVTVTWDGSGGPEGELELKAGEHVARVPIHWERVEAETGGR